MTTTEIATHLRDVANHLRVALELAGQRIDDTGIMPAYARKVGRLEAAIEIAIASLESAAAREGA